MLSLLVWSWTADAHTCEQEGDGRLIEVVSLNAWGLPPPFAPDRKRRLPRIDRVLRESRFDIVGLQEVWRGARRLMRRDHLHLPDRAGDSGLALLSEHVTGSVLVHRFQRSVGFDALKSKGFLDARMELPDVGSVRVIVTHLQAGRSKRAAAVRATQVQEILAHLTEIIEPLVVMGDFNFYDDLPIDALSIQRLEGAGLIDAAVQTDADRPTYPGQRARLDRVYLRCGARTCLHPEMALVLAELDSLSDHRPVYVQVRARRRARAMQQLTLD